MRFLKIYNIIQLEKPPYAKICGAKRLFHNLWITVLEKFKTWNHEDYCVLFSSSVFFQEQLSKFIPERSSSKTLQNFVENTHGKIVLAAGHRPSYVQKLNCTVCCPWNFEANISRNIFNWLLYLSCFMYYDFPNSYRVIILCLAFVSMQHIFRKICWSIK